MTTTQPSQVRSPLRSALTRYRVLAYATGVFLILLTIHVLVQWYQSSSEDIAFSAAKGLGRWVPHGDTWIPATHGWLYLIYVVSAVDLWLRTRLNPVLMLLVVAAGTIPLMSFVAERWVTARVRPMIEAAEAAAGGAAGGSPVEDVPAAQ